MSEDERCVTVEMKVAYFQPATDGKLNCAAEVFHRSKRLGYLESEVRNGDRLVVKASATFSIFFH